jgi:probable rRNA maturation factor
MADIQFFFNEVPAFLKKRRKLKGFIRNIFERKGIKLKSLTCIFCSDEYLLNINKQFLKHNYYTDIITFNLHSPNNIEGELYISTDRVKENAKNHKTLFDKEMHRVIFHGILHLCGYNDKTPSQKILIRQQENLLLKKYFSL